MATHFSILAWRIPGTEEPVGLPSMGSHRVRHELAAAAVGILKKKKKKTKKHGLLSGETILELMLLGHCQSQIDPGNENSKLQCTSFCPTKGREKN